MFMWDWGGQGYCYVPPDKRKAATELIKQSIIEAINEPKGTAGWHECIDESAKRYGNAYRISKGNTDALPGTVISFVWNNDSYCPAPAVKRQAAIELINQRAIEAANEKAAKSKHDAEQGAADAQFLKSHLEAAKAVEEKAAADKADAERRTAETHAAEARANSERAEADRRIAEAADAAGRADAVIATAQAAKEKVPALEKTAAERTALAKKAAAEAEKAVAENAEANRRIAAANATIEQADATIAAAQAAKDKAAAAERAAAERAAAELQQRAANPEPAPTPAPSEYERRMEQTRNKVARIKATPEYMRVEAAENKFLVCVDRLRSPSWSEFRRSGKMIPYDLHPIVEPETSSPAEVSKTIEGLAGNMVLAIKQKPGLEDLLASLIGADRAQNLVEEHIKTEDPTWEAWAARFNALSEKLVYTCWDAGTDYCKLTAEAETGETKVPCKVELVATLQGLISGDTRCQEGRCEHEVSDGHWQ